MDPKLPTLFAINAPVIELVLQGTAIYLLLFLLFRFVVRREVIPFGIAEMLVLVLIADASQNALTEKITTLSETVILAGTMLAWHLLLRLAFVLRHRLVRSLRRAHRKGTDTRRTHPAASGSAASS